MSKPDWRVQHERGSEHVNLILDGRVIPFPALEAFKLGTALRVASGIDPEPLFSDDDEVGWPWQ